MSTPEMDGQLSFDDEWDDDQFNYCDHDHDDYCYTYSGELHCYHYHCINCGGCGCPGYCDDYQTYNLRPEETGG